MSLFNLILSGLVFLSSMVIVLLFSRRMKRLKLQKKNNQERSVGNKIKSQIKIGFNLNFLFSFLIKKPFYFFVSTIKRFKKLLEFYKKEIDVLEEEELDKDKQENSSNYQIKRDNFSFSKKRIGEISSKNKSEQSLFQKNKVNVSRKGSVEIESEDLKENENIFNWRNFLIDFKNKIKKNDFDYLEEKEEIVYPKEGDFENNQFSDGLVEIKKSDNSKPQQDYLIKEVVQVDRFAGKIIEKDEEDLDLDDKLGIDRKILEKKLLGKITKDPKNVEHYRQLGELYIKMQNYEDAQNSYEFILKLTPEDETAFRRLQKIKLLKRLS